MKSPTDFPKYAESIRNVRARLSKRNLPADNKWMNSIAAFIQSSGSQMMSELSNLDQNDPFAGMIQRNKIENREATTTDLSAKIFVCCNLLLIGSNRMLAVEERPRLGFLQMFDITGDGKDTIDVPTLERYLEQVNRYASATPSFATRCIQAYEAIQKRHGELLLAHQQHQNRLGNNAENAGGGMNENATDPAIAGAQNDKNVSKTPTMRDAMDDIHQQHWTNIHQGNDFIINCMNGCIGIISNAELQTEFVERCNYWCEQIEQIAAKYPQDQAQTQAIGERGQLEVNEQTEVVGAAAGGIGGQTSGNKGQRKAGARTAEAMAAAE